MKFWLQSSLSFFHLQNINPQCFSPVPKRSPKSIQKDSTRSEKVSESRYERSLARTTLLASAWLHTGKYYCDERLTQRWQLLLRRTVNRYIYDSVSVRRCDTRHAREYLQPRAKSITRSDWCSIYWHLWPVDAVKGAEQNQLCWLCRGIDSSGCVTTL